MQGDFSRDTFDARHQFSRVLMQQGRVLLDADWNEQTSILLHYLRTLAADLIGPHGGPGRGFEIRCGDADDHACDFTIGWGHYYVDGMLVENAPPTRYTPVDMPPLLTYRDQPSYPFANDEELQHGTDYLVYLDVWERHLTHLDMDHIREVALGGPDTATRAQVVWQVKVADESECDHLDEDASCDDLLREVIGKHACGLRARARVPEPSHDPCIIPPEARYRGAENQLYRVEIHDPSTRAGAGAGATFKWSRDNGSVVFGVRSITDSVVTLDTLGPDERRSLKEDDWVEVTDDYHELRGEPGVLARVDAVERVTFAMTLDLAEGVALPQFDSKRHPLLRRWDQGSAPIPVQTGRWIDLEDGVQVWFEPNGTYRTGDYWLIPARTATGGILWPSETNPGGIVVPRALAPHGIVHHYAPLARIRFADGDGEERRCDDCRCIFEPLCPSAWLEDLYFSPDTESPREGMREVVIANAKLLSTRLAADADVRVKVTGYAPSGQGAGQALTLARRRAEAVVELYVHSGIARDRMAVSAKLDDASRPPETRHRVVTRLVKPSEHVLADEELGIAGLTRIAGVGRVRAEKLLNASRSTPADVAAMSVEEIVSLLEVKDAVAESIRNSARTIAEEEV